MHLVIFRLEQKIDGDEEGAEGKERLVLQREKRGEAFAALQSKMEAISTQHEALMKEYESFFGDMKHVERDLSLALEKGFEELEEDEARRADRTFPPSSPSSSNLALNS